jgi:polyhydroxyalkanoate synthesis regulator phasin
MNKFRIDNLLDDLENHPKIDYDELHEIVKDFEPKIADLENRFIIELENMLEKLQ